MDMKNKCKFLILILAMVAFSCAEQDTITVDGNYVSFVENDVSVSLPSGESATGEFNVLVAERSNSDRNYNLVVTSSVPSSSYSVPSSVTIPAGSNSATVDFSVIDDGGYGLFGGQINVSIEDTAENLTVKELPLDVAITCDTPVVVAFVFDAYPEETSWELFDSDDNLLISGGGYDDETSFSRGFCLVPGEYTFIVYDVFSDGICCTYGNGSYTVSIGNTVLASGGDFGASESTTFTIE